MNTIILFARFAVIGALGGALFGVVFGLIASIFRNGPPPLVAIQQSWWWFAISGMCMGLAWAGGQYADTHNPHNTIRQP
ncbi:MAG: hypothetical protein RML40_02885 [Bacteroidota bacterium]|nr:hypothetical protein [Candidatus Kapabacteria bacterium]MDW8219456.1 hypothetical protein [Bacteroidota bacterium]